MIGKVRAGFRDTPLGPAAVIWSFGYLLLDAIAFLIGRAAPGVTLLASLPMFALGVGQTIALNHLRTGPVLQSAWLRWPALVVAVVAATAVQTLFDVYWMRFLAENLFPAWQEWALDIDLQRLLTVGFGYAWTFCLALTLLAAMRAAQDNARRAANAETEAANAVSAALRLQLNPHFLFNTLNSISGLVTLDRKQEAESMIDRLAEFLRASLNADPIEDVMLAHEIDTIDAYLHIESARFGDRLEIQIDLAPGTEDAKVPNFILQPLVENAIKHGVSALQGTALLYISAAREGDMLMLTVVNSSPESNGESSRPPAGTGVGLANSRQRLANRYGGKASLETGPVGDRYRATIRMPFLT
ncbi:MAG TPA: histidine kinase [Allosphingosinicella sp.]|nr:histidine kinase [Allosphingosinicella sp.]